MSNTGCRPRHRGLMNGTATGSLCLAGALIWILSAMPALSPAAEEQAQSVVSDADAVRFPSDSYGMEVTITNRKKNADDDVRGYRVLVKDRNTTLIKFISPATERGKAVLGLNNDIWIYLPDAGMAVRIPPQQRLVGNVAVGDIARAAFAGDYRAEIASITTYDGKPCYVLDLKARDDSVTYQRVKYWVHRETHQPLKAEFYTDSRMLLKTAYYEAYAETLGRLRPARLRIVDGIRNDLVSILEYRDMKLETLPAKIFNKNYLKRLD